MGKNESILFPRETQLMPTVPNVLGQPKPPNKVMIQPPITQVTEPVPDPVRTVTMEVPEPIPEPALTAADHIPKSQDQLAAESIAQQTVAKRNTMTANAEPAYQ